MDVYTLWPTKVYTVCRKLRKVEYCALNRFNKANCCEACKDFAFTGSIML